MSCLDKQRLRDSAESSVIQIRSGLRVLLWNTRQQCVLVPKPILEAIFPIHLFNSFPIPAALLSGWGGEIICLILTTPK